MQISKIVSFQPSSIYHHLRESLHKATTDAFPEHCQDLRSVPITFSCITPDPLTDIATPYPLKISWFLSLPVTTVTQRIIDCFQINSDYISTTKDTLFRNGFLNFSLSDTFLLRSVYETSISETESVSLPAGNIPEILKKIQILLQRFTPSEVPACDQFVIRPLPHSTP
ncbi:MAG TPA: hypothetical protein VHO70_06830, partial [Chitinispirillaceae bacterium]|nr:hypothetical protein [Chitinispirillaceae bacterium]